MLLSTLLPFFLVSFVYAQLLVQDTMDFELETISMTCPETDYTGHAPLDVENYPIAPSMLQLEQVYLFVRHGALKRFFVHLLSYSP